MTVKEIIKDWLEKHGYDGLYTDKCGCSRSFLFPCLQEGVISCKPGYWHEDKGKMQADKPESPTGSCDDCKPCRWNQECPHSTETKK